VTGLNIGLGVAAIVITLIAHFGILLYYAGRLTGKVESINTQMIALTVKVDSIADHSTRITQLRADFERLDEKYQRLNDSMIPELVTLVRDSRKS
jgi:hypothetical protein